MPATPEPKGAEPASSELVVPDLVVPEPSVPQPAGPLGNLVAAHLHRVEVAMLGRILTTTLVGALPPAMVRVERRRNLAKWLLRRPGHAVGIAITAADKTLTFRAPEVGVTEASVSHTVHGVVLSTTRITVADWLSQLADVLNTATDDDEATRTALERALLT